MPNYEQPQSFSRLSIIGQSSSDCWIVPRIWWMPNGVLLYPSTLDASLRTMLLVLPYSVVTSAFIPPDESTVDFLRGCLRNGPPWWVFTLSGFLSLIRHCSNRYNHIIHAVRTPSHMQANNHKGAMYRSHPSANSSETTTWSRAVAALIRSMIFVMLISYDSLVIHNVIPFVVISLKSLIISSPVRVSGCKNRPAQFLGRK